MKKYDKHIIIFLLSATFIASIWIFFSCVILDPYHNETLTLINEHRETPLKWDDDLEIIALDQSRYMSSTGDYGHIRKDGTNLIDRFKARNYKTHYIGENIYRGYETPQAAIKSWMKSDCHRERIQDENYRVVGMSGVNGYWTMVLSK